MKTNHRDGTKKRHDHGAGYRGAFNQVKVEARKTRRNVERRFLNKIRTESVDPDAVIPGRNVEVSNGWWWD